MTDKEAKQAAEIDDESLDRVASGGTRQYDDQYNEDNEHDGKGW